MSSVEEVLAPFMACDILVGDMNARHDRWGYVADVCGHNTQGRAVSRVLVDMSFMVPSDPTHDGISVIDLCAFRWSPHKYWILHRARLPHAAQIVTIKADTDVLPALKLAYVTARWDMIEKDLGDILPSDENIWLKTRAIVNSIPRLSHRRER